MKEIMFKALYKHMESGNKYWQYITTNYKVDEVGFVRVTDWLQYVGMKDKKDESIFEGDVFKFRYVEKQGKAIDLMGSFSFGEDLSFEIDVYNNEEYVVLHYVNNGQFKDFEVIGNIKETPSLIEDMSEC